MKILSKTEIEAFTRLLKSNDLEIFPLLFEQVAQFDDHLLQEIYDSISVDERILKTQYLNLVKKSKREKLKHEFKQWASNDSSLENGIFLVASFNNPFLQYELIVKRLNDLSQQLKKNLEEIKLTEDPSSVINEVNHFLFMEVGFDGNKKDFFDKNNSYIDQVLETRLGNPILLSIIYILVTNRLGLPFEGVKMPAHFLVKYVDRDDPIFVDPFNKGEIITADVCKERINSLKLPWSEDYLVTPSSKQIITRVLQNLFNIYQNDQELELKEYLGEYIKILK